VKVVKFGFIWIVEHEKKVRFERKPGWYLPTGYAQYWDIYSMSLSLSLSVMNELPPFQMVGMGGNSNSLLGGILALGMRCCQLLAVCPSPPRWISLVWQLENKRIYYTSSLYHVINFRGVSIIFIPSLWQLKMPPYLPLTCLL
jgi:hypothetical protein